MEDVRSILARCPYFRGVPPQIMHVSAAYGQHVSVSRQHLLCSEGDEPDAAWVLGRGVVEARKQFQEDHFDVLATMKSGTLFGHVALLDAKPRTATLITMASSELVCFNSDDFMGLLKGNEPAGRFFRRAIILALGDTLLAAATHVKDLTQKGEPERVEDPEQFLRRLREKLQGGR